MITRHHEKIIIISATTIVIGMHLSLTLVLKHHYIMKQKLSKVKSIITIKEEIPAFPKADRNAKKIDNDFSVVTNPKSNLVLINKHRKLPDGYIPEDLTRPNVPFISPKDKEKHCCERSLQRHLKTCLKLRKRRA